MASGNYTLAELLDLALCTPEIGAVNFNILHRLLHAILSRLDISTVRVHVDGFDFQRPVRAGSPWKPTATVQTSTYVSIVGL